MKKLLMILLSVTVLLVPTLSFASTWLIDADHSNVGFKIRHLKISNVKGVFHKMSGVVNIDERDITRSKATATIETASLDTGVKMRDKDLKGPKYFDVSRYPTMTFESTGISVVGGGKLKVSGELTLHGVTRPVVLDVEGPTQEVKDPQGKVRRGASASTKIDRKEFGITSGGALIADEVDISIEVELVKVGGE